MYPASRTLVALLLCLMTLSGNASFVAAQSSASSDQKQTDKTTDSKQQPRKITRRYDQRRSKRARIKAATSGETCTAPQGTSGPIALVNEASEPEFLIGQAEVVVKGNQDPIIRLGLAQHGSTVVEFPALDNFFVVHPGGSEVVAVDESPTLATDHYLVFRAGKEFAAPLPNSKRRAVPEATVSVQMVSGMFVTFSSTPSAASLRWHIAVLSSTRGKKFSPPAAHLASPSIWMAISRNPHRRR